MLLDGGAAWSGDRGGCEGGPGIGARKSLERTPSWFRATLRSLTDLDALAARVKAEFDTFDLLFVNAGFSIRAPLESMTEAVYDEMFNLNAKGPLFARAEARAARMTRREALSSSRLRIANVKGMPGDAAYGAAKAALRSFARVLAAELLPREIRVNAVTPGPIDTPIWAMVSDRGRGRPA